VIIVLLEMAGLLASLTTLAVVRRSFRGAPRVWQASLLGLVGLLALGHLANILEANGMVWADTIADQFSTTVPFLWGLFLLETGRAYLSARLRASDDQVRFFLEDVPTSVAWVDADARLLGFSRAWARAFPTSAKGVQLSSVVAVALPDLADTVRRCLHSESASITARAEESGAARDGARRYFRWSIRAWAHPDHAAGALVILEEITEEHEAEAARALAAEELARMQRLAHVGQMAAGAAHDFNNFLQIIQFEIEDEPRRVGALDNVRLALDSARQMTRSMLRFGAAEQAAHSEGIDLVPLLRDMQRMLSNALGRRHHLDVRLPETGGVTINGSVPRIQQALLNLAVNARDAMPHGGSIQIRLSVIGNEALLSVQDGGIGMSEAVRSQLFKPFFTTKGLQGTGLGLRVVQSVVEEHHGQLSIESEPERGSTFHLHLPLRSTQSN
jgi:PAS domain S-box-containing protein